MQIFQYMEQHGHEQLVFCFDKVSGLKAIIAIHDTTLGPALGGCRMWKYDCEDDAILDALRLAKGMTYKNSAMGLNLGGGKTVVIGDPRRDKTEELFRALGRFVESLGGRYITAEDVGIGTEDIGLVRMETDNVAGLPDKSGEPSPATAFGVYRGMKACVRAIYKTESLRGKVVAVQGVGQVGYYLCRHLYDEGARLIVSDIYQDRLDVAAKEFGAQAVPPEEIYAVESDIFSPCALGAVVNDQTIKQFKCKIIAGSANNQLQEPSHGDQLHKMGILYAPDYVINGGGVTNVAHERHPAGYNHERAYSQIATIYDKISRIIEISRVENIPTYRAADVLAEGRLDKLARLGRIRLPGQTGRG